MKTWYTSDSHFGHANIIKYCNRPFVSVEEMNAAIIANWNDVVAPDDLVYHLGDFAMGNRKRIPELRSQLNGRIHLIRGNHDYGKFLDCFDEVSKSALVEDEGFSVELVHNPRHVEGTGTFALCGHVHDLWVSRVKGEDVPEYVATDHYDPEFAAAVDIFNVGMDVRGFRPRSLLEILHAK